MSEQNSEKLKKLIEKRMNYQISMWRMKRGSANRQYYENLIDKNSREIMSLGGNVFDIDDANEHEVETRGQMIANMSLGRKWIIVLRYWSIIILFAAAGFTIYYYLFM